MAGPELPFVVGLRAGLLPSDAGRARVPGHSRPSRRPSRAPRGAAHPARPGPDGGPRPTSRANPAGLTAREAEVLGLLADGLSYAEVAEALILSEKTVGHHVSAVLRKLGEPTRPRAVATALRLGIIPPR